MKNRSTLQYLSSMVIMLLFLPTLSCKKSASYHDVVYLTMAEKSNSTILTADNNGAELALSVSASNLVGSDITATIATDTTLVARYNTLTGKQYSPLPKGSYSLSASSVTIKSGSTISDAIKFKVSSVRDFQDGVSYIMPITIQSATGLPVLDASRTLFVIVKRVVITTVASLKGNYFKVDFSTNNSTLKAMTAVTYEARVMANNFQQSSPFISSIMGIEENFLFRFGDVTVKPNQLQLAGGVTATNVSMDFSTGIWYHLAGVYDGSKLQIYVNGTLVATTVASRTIDLTDPGGFYFGRSAGGRLLDGYISEGRVWSRALTQSEIINGMCGINPASTGLVGYWKFNEGTGNIAHDISGNGHDATAASAVTWTPNVRCN